MKYLLILLFASTSYADWATCAPIGFCGVNPSLPIGSGGPFINLGSNGSANMNAAIHITLALTIPLVGQELGGTHGKWIAGISWIALTLIQESIFHAPANPGAGYPSEVRTDLITRIVPTLVVLSW